MLSLKNFLIKIIPYKKSFKKKLEESGYFDEEFYVNTYGQNKGIKPLKHFIEYGMKENKKPNEQFDPVWYRKYYTDFKNNKMEAFEHYILYGKEEGRFQNSFEAGLLSSEFIQDDALEPDEKELHKLNSDQLQEYEIIKNCDLEWQFYIEERSHTPLSSNPIVDYILSWKEHQPTLPGVFETSFYMEVHPDIRASGINPLFHYLTLGKDEKRQGMASRNIMHGKHEYDDKKETIVLASHESSATGAPLLGYNIADKLLDQYNIIHIVIKKANLHETFLETCDTMLYDIDENTYSKAYSFMKTTLESRPIKAIICNSAVTNEIMSAAHTLMIPSLLMVHEFSDYVKPAGTIMGMVFQADYIVVPAKIIQDSVQEELIRYANNWLTPKSIQVIPQGKLPYIPGECGADDSAADLRRKLGIKPDEDVKVVVGSGWVHIRKGVDLFIAMAKLVKQNYAGKCKFVWVGGGFDTEADLAYSAWINRELKFSGLDEDFMFLEHQKNLDTIFSIADVFCLTSRMDPFPNVVVDALYADLHIACFNNTTGSSEFMLKHKANCTVVDYLDTHQLADGIIEYLKSLEGISKGQRPFQGVNRKIVEEYLNFDAYVSDLKRLIDDAVAFKRKSAEIIEILLESGEFNADYYDGKSTPAKSCQKYVESSLKTLRLQNPKPGFSHLKWLLDNHKVEEEIVPLYEAMKQGKTITHESRVVPYPSTQKVNIFYAVHLHLFYADLAQEFAEYFTKLPGKFDILVTMVNEENRKEAEEVFAHCGANEVKIVLVENIGRDSGALFFGLRDTVLTNNYDVVGHFHTKKSFDVEGGIGDRWRKFLNETLLGDEAVSHSILELFNDKKLGLVFPDDRHVIDKGANQEYIDGLCNMMDLPKVEETPIFPLGNMFWARVDAVKDLFELDPEKVLQEEPLPYDGSYMHAIERITPTLVEKNGYGFKTVYKEGVLW